MSGEVTLDSTTSQTRGVVSYNQCENVQWNARRLACMSKYLPMLRITHATPLPTLDLIIKDKPVICSPKSPNKTHAQSSDFNTL